MIPKDIIFNIIKFLIYEEFKDFIYISNNFYQIINNNNLWKYMLKRDFNLPHKNQEYINFLGYNYDQVKGYYFTKCYKGAYNKYFFEYCYKSCREEKIFSLPKTFVKNNINALPFKLMCQYIKIENKLTLYK